MSDTKRVLITGASGGFGHEAAKALAARGHVVYATMRGVTGKNAEKAAALEGWAKTEGHTLHVLELDVTDDGSVTTGVARAVEAGGIDVLINNAGTGTWGIDEGFSIEQAKAIYEINVFGVMRMNQAVLPHFRERGRGTLVYLSSGLGRIVLPFIGVYGSSKFAVEGYAEAMNIQLAPLGIESVIVQPGAYGTGFLMNSIHPAADLGPTYGPVAGMFAAFGGAFEERAKSGGLGNPAEVVEALVEEVERTGPRPLRHPVGHDVSGPVSTINGVCHEVQEGLLKAFGLRK